jgi:penicillin-binding protein 1B
MDRSALLFAPSLRVSKTHARMQRRKAISNRRSKFLRPNLLRLMIIVCALALISFTGFLIHSYRTYAAIVDARLAHGYLKSRGGVFAAPRTLRPGQKYSRETLAAILRRAGYVESESASDVWNGSFAVRDNSVEIHANSALESPSVVHVIFSAEGRIAQLTGDDFAIDSFTLAPESLTNDPATRGAAHTQLSFKDIPPVLVQAITSIEDRRFFDHHGLDFFGVARALVRNVGEEKIGQGGSTITQQLVKNTYLTPERTLRRKYAEAMLAFTIERRLSKEDIFALYCNEVFLGQRGAMAVRGVDQAAHVYFGKELKQVTLAEAATIAGMIQSPTRYSPVRQNDAARARRNTVLGAMVRDGLITLEQAAAAAKDPLAVADFDPARESVAPYFIDYVNRLAEASAATNTAAKSVDQSLANRKQDGGTPIITTIDLDLQQLAGEAIEHQLKKLSEVYQSRGAKPQAALVALDPRTGKVLAMIGGRNYAESQLNRATDARRQPGSTFKPFVYAAALESGMSPLRSFSDTPHEFTYAGGQKYRPSNYGGGFSMREVAMRTGLVKSLNVVTVDVAMETGLARVANTALKFGLPRPIPYPALALGTKEATPLEMATAYAVFANGGTKIQPQVIENDVASPPAEQAVAPTTAFMITDMLQDVIDRGTARAAKGAIPHTALAGKTGTSRDGWFIGYTPNLVCAVWIGFDDNQQLGLTGAEAALPAWTEFVKAAVNLRPELGGRAFDQPEGITIAEIDPETDALATGQCPSHERVAVRSDQAPTAECFRHNVYFDLTAQGSVAEVMSVPKSAYRQKRNDSLLAQSALNSTTRIESDSGGRKSLVNEMRAGGR